MKNNKDTLVNVRLDRKLSSDLKKVCDAEKTTVSNLIRRLATLYVNNHPLTTKRVEIDFSIEPYPSSHPESYYCYYITARLKQDFDDIKEIDKTFILPEFYTKNHLEPFRVDSHFQYRAIIPNGRNSKNRVLGAKFVNNEWKGSIFIYDDSILNNPEEKCFKEIKEKMESNILKTLLEIERFTQEVEIENQCYEEKDNQERKNR